MRNKFLIISIIIFMASVLETEYVLAQADEQGLCVPHKVSVQPHFGQVQLAFLMGISGSVSFYLVYPAKQKHHEE